MFFPTPLWVRLAVAAVGFAGLIIGGLRLMNTVKRYSGAGGKFIADTQTSCVYPELYVTRKNAKESGQFIPVTRQVTFPDRKAALKAGYHQCQN